MTATLEPARMSIDGKTYFMEPGVIESTSLGYEDHGIFTLSLAFAFNSSGQSAGLMCMDKPVPKEQRSKNYSIPYINRVGTAYGHDLIIRVLSVIGVSTWEKVQGKRAYALRENNYGYIRGISSIDDPTVRYLIFDQHAQLWREKEGDK